MGLMKPKTSSTCEWSAFVRYSMAASALPECPDRKDVAYSPGMWTFLCYIGTAVTEVQRCFLFFLRKYMSQRRRQTFVLGLLFFLFGDLISAEIETPTWPAATGEVNTGKYAVSWLLTYTTGVTAISLAQACTCICSPTTWHVKFNVSQPTYVNIFLICNLIRCFQWNELHFFLDC